MKLFFKGKISSVIKISLIACITLFWVSPTFANETESKGELKKEITQMSNSEFDAWMADYVVKNKNKDIQEKKKELKDLGVEFTDSPESDIGVSLKSSGGYPSDVDLSVVGSKRTQDNYWRVQSILIVNNTLWDCGSLDLLSVEWDPKRAAFYSYSTDGNFTSLLDYSKSGSGALLFNVEDKRMYAGDSTYGVAYVTLKSGTSGDLEMATKYTHTYNDTSVTWQVGSNVGYSTTGPSGGITYTLTGSTVPANWTKSDVNAVINP